MIKFNQNWMLIFCLLSLVSSNSWAIINFEDHAFPELVTSARALAVGNAYLCKADDPWAVFYNPAGLGTVRQTSFHPGNFHFELNKGFFNVTQGQTGDIPSKISKNFKPNDLKENLQEHPDNIVHSRINLYPNFTTRYLSLGYFYSRRSRAALASSTSKLELNMRQDHGPLLGLNMSLWGGIFKLGATAAYVNRSELQKDYLLTQNIDPQDSDYKKGSAFIVTTGTRLTLPWTFLPTFAAVMRNSGNQKFHPRDTRYHEPTKIQQTMDVGFSITPQVSQRSRIHLEINYRDIYNAYKTDAKRRIGAGLEFDIARTFFLRLGTGDGFGSGGFGISTSSYTLDLTTYAVDKTETEFRGKEDRRFVLSLSSGI